MQYITCTACIYVLLPVMLKVGMHNPYPKKKAKLEEIMCKSQDGKNLKPITKLKG